MSASQTSDLHPPSHRHGYQIAIICALEEERDAVLGLMRRYPRSTTSRYGTSHADYYQYQFGELGDKPVVLTLLIRPGSTESAYSATNLLHSFPNIKYVLIVGITAGVPFLHGKDESAKTDENLEKLARLAGVDPVQEPNVAAKLQWSNVKLGDVIISEQVIDWDFGRQFSDRIKRKTEPSVALSATPRNIRAILQNITAWDFDDTLLPAVRKTIPKSSRLNSKFLQKPVAHDHLYAASHRHKHHKASANCDQCNKCVEPWHSPCEDALRLSCEELGCIPLHTIEHKNGDEEIHFGLVASGKNTLKSSKHRNDAVRQVNFIGFEMEGVGTWEAVPTIVVKSVVDYADSHKSKAWREYPAGRAALCAEALISLLQLPDLPSAGMLHEVTLRLDNMRQTVWDFTRKQEQQTWHEKSDECLRDLFVVNPQDDLTRIEAEKEELVETACEWIFCDKEYLAFTNWNEERSQQSRLLWIKGPAGTGKTMLLIGIIRRLSRQPAVTAPGVVYFFCQGYGTTINTATAALRSLIWMLAIQQQHLIPYIHKEYRHSRAPFTGKTAFSALSRVFKDMVEDIGRVYIIVDALDECEEDLKDLICLLSTSLGLSTKIRWLVSSRPEVQVLGLLRKPNDRNWVSAQILIKLDIEDRNDRIEKYMQHKLSNLEKWSEFGPSYSQSILATVKAKMLEQADGNFLWLFLVFKDLETTKPEHAVECIEGYENGLPGLYEKKFSRLQKEETKTQKQCADILRITCLAYRSLSLSEIARLCPWAARLGSTTIIKKCVSFITTKEEIVYLNHKSAKDFLVGNLFQLPTGVIGSHADIVWPSICAMSSTLKMNICNLQHCGMRSAEITIKEEKLLAGIRYSCIFWLRHLREAIVTTTQHREQLIKVTSHFLRSHLLHWLESLCLFQSLPDSILNIRDLLDVIKAEDDETADFVEFLEDVGRFVISSRSMIEHNPLQVYAAALTFCPKSCKVYKILGTQRFNHIPAMKSHVNRWDVCLQTIKGHQQPVNAVAFSHDGQLMASASSDCTIMLWDGIKGAYKRSLQSHKAYVLDIAFHPKLRTTLATAAKDGTVRIWDATKGSCRAVLRGHRDWVNSLAFSNDGTKLASGSSDSTLRIYYTDGHWNDDDIQGYESPLTGHSGGVLAVAFSVDGNRLASASDDRTVRFWDVTQGTTEAVFDYSDHINGAAFSIDSASLALALSDGTVQLLSLETAERKSLEGHTGPVNAVVYLQNGMLASCSTDRTVRLWDTTTNTCKDVLKGHNDWINDIALSPDRALVSASSDRTIRVWDCTSITSEQSPMSHDDSINAIAFSPSGEYLASASKDGKLKIWCLSKYTCIWILDGHSGHILALAFSSSGTTLVLGSSDGSLWLLHPATGTYRSSFSGHRSHVSAVAFSPEGKLVASASQDQTVRLWNDSDGSCIMILESHNGKIVDLSFSRNGGRLALACEEGTLLLWKAAPLSHGDSLPAPRAWSTADRQPQLTLMGGPGLRSVCFSMDGSCLETNLTHHQIAAPTQRPSGSAASSTRLVDFSHFKSLPAKTSGFEVVWDFLLPGIDNLMLDPAWGLDLKSVGFSYERFRHRSLVKIELIFANGQYMNLYNAVHGWCTTPQNEKYRLSMYRDLFRKLKEYLDGHFHKLISILDTEAIPSTYAKEWMRYESAAKYTGRLLRYANRHLVVRARNDGHKDIYSVYDFYLLQWRTVLLPQISQKLSNAILELINDQRHRKMGQYHPVKIYVDSLVAVCTGYEDGLEFSLDLYDEYFNDSFLEASAHFYETESQKFDQHNIVEYTRNIERILETEKQLQMCLHPDTSSKLETLFKKTLIADHAGSLLASFRALLLEEREHDMRCTYNVLSQIPEGVSLLSEFTPRLRKAGLSTVLNAASDAEQLESKEFSGIVRSRYPSMDETSAAEDESTLISVEGGWISQGGQKLLRLPSHYTVTCAALHNRTLALGLASGQISIFEFPAGTRKGANDGKTFFETTIPQNFPKRPAAQVNTHGTSRGGSLEP